MTRKQFTFYESFARALSRIKDKSDRADAYDALVSYALYGVEPDLDSMSDVAAVAFELIKPNLDSSRKKASSGKSGGSKREANRKQNGSKMEANGKQEGAEKEEANKKQTVSKKEGEKEGEKEKEREMEKENECYLSPPAPSRGSERKLFLPPTYDEVLEAAKARGVSELARPFFDYYSAAEWRDSDGKPVYSWLQKLIAWKVREDDRLRKQLSAEKRAGAGNGGNIFAEMLREEGESP